MGKSKIDLSFTKQNWRNFEILTGLLFEIEFKLEKQEIFLTKMSRDGGKDIKIAKDFYSKIIKFPTIEIWIEAKLRGKINRVNIGDIAGSVIMASNSNIRSIYFVTNCFFTKQTVEELLLFAYKSGLQINLINGFNYSTLLKEHFDKVVHRVEKGKSDIVDIQGFVAFMEKFRESLPDYPDPHQNELNLTIDRGRVLPKTKYESIIKQEEKIGLRNVSTKSLLESKKVLKLSDAKVSPVVGDKELESNISFQLIGGERKNLLEEVLLNLNLGEVVILKGNSGQGKTFFANHIIRRSYQNDYTVLFIDGFENNIISFSKEIISSLIGLDYFKFLENDTAVINYLSEYFQLDQAIGMAILEIMRKDKFTEIIATEVCLEISVRLIENHNKRKKLLLVVDNLHKKYPTI